MYPGNFRAARPGAGLRNGRGAGVHHHLHHVGRGWQVLVDQRHRRFELLVHLADLLRGHLALQPALLLEWRRLDDRSLLHLPSDP
jgi:hypothetical protein